MNTIQNQIIIMFNKIGLKFILFFFLLIIGTQSLLAQDLLKGKDLSQIKVDQLSSTEIAKLKAQLINSGMTPDQAEQMAISKGMSPSEAAKLKQKITASNENSDIKNRDGKLDKSVSKKQADQPDTFAIEKPKTLINPLIFGSELFTSVSPNFEPSSNLATPMNYILGPNDQISITVYGVQEYSGDLTVSSEGNVSIPNVGQVKIAGMTIEAATQKLKNVMGNSTYTYLKSGGAKISVTLSKIRTIRVTIIGSYKPNNYNLSSLATVFNALHVAGGPSEFGSFREIELIRKNQPIKKIDLYRFLLQGDQSDNIGLQDNDVIRIPQYNKRVEIQGQAKRPGIFEVLPNESFKNILDFASGFTDTAYKASVKVLKRSEKERKVGDLEAISFETYHPESGEVFIISKILERFQNRVRISGAVFRPDVYELKQGLTVAELIKKADGLKEDAFTGFGQILRLKDDLTQTNISFDIKQALKGDTANNIILQREDQVFITSVLDLKDNYKVTIQGEVRYPGKYDFAENLTLKDLILQAGGFTDAAYKSIEIARIIKRDSISISDLSLAQIIKIDLYENDLKSSSSKNFKLSQFDVVTIRKKSGFLLPESVTIKGQVQFPGPYAIQSRGERISDVLKRAGGFTPEANPEGAYLIRNKTEEEKKKAEEDAKNVKKALKDTTSILEKDILSEFSKVPFEMKLVLDNPGSLEDLILKANDEIVIPKFNDLVKISGEVLLVTQVPFRNKNNFKDYISAAGGFSSFALKKRSYIVYANGKAAATSHFLFFNSYPKVKPGSEIIIPQKKEKKASTTGEIIGIASALASLAGVVIAILKL